MTDSHTAQTFASQTAVMGLLIELLIETGALDRSRVTEALYGLLQLHGDEGHPITTAGPIRHLISMVEEPAGTSPLRFAG